VGALDAINKLKRIQAAGVEGGLPPAAPARGLGAGLKAIEAVNAVMDVYERMGGEEGEGEVVDELNDVKRIISLPLIQPLDPSEYESFCRENSVQAAYQDPDDPFRFNRLQVEGILSWLEIGGLLGLMAVGTGKTLLLQAISSLAIANGHQRIVQLLPKNLIEQYLRTQLPWARKRTPIRFHPHSFADLDPEHRNSLSQSKRKGVYLLPYTTLSREKSVNILEDIQPSLILADEAHYLSNPIAAVTKRVFRYLDAYEDCEFVAVSGSMTKKGPEDFAHLAERALRQRTPFPMKKAMLAAWHLIVEAGAVPSSGAAGPIRPLIGWAKRHFPMEEFPDDVSGFRKALKLRVQTAPGVVASTAKDDIATSLCYVNLEIEEPEKCAGWEKLEELRAALELLGETPNGDTVDHELNAYKWYYEFSAGFYNELVWPTPEKFAKHRKLTDAEAEAFIQLGKDHHVLLNGYHKLLRGWLEHNKNPMGSHGPIDTPMLVGREMSQTKDRHVPGPVYLAWQEAKKAEIPGMAERISRAVRVCPFKINAAVAWAAALTKKGEGSILWVYHIEIGEWLFEAMKAAGLPVSHCPAGENPKHEKLVSESLEHGPADMHYVTSAKAHHRGHNMQHHRNQYFVQTLREADIMEQCVGRLHRQGQKADHLDVTLSITTPFEFKVFSACANDALYVHQAGGNRQKLLYGDYTPKIQTFSPEVCRQQGIELKRLDRTHQKQFNEKFGEG
jgi:hypothetical protein